MTRAFKRRRPAGIALILALVVVLLLTAYMSEFFFSTGLELRSMRTFKDVARARGMARLAFKAMQAGLMLDEVDFFSNLRNMEKVLVHSAIPWQDGFLIELVIIPQDGLFNLNELPTRVSTETDRVRWNLFQNTLADIEIPSDLPDLPPQPIDPGALADIYAALVDWLDPDDVAYQGFSRGVGAEQADYFSGEPEVSTKNKQLDRLSEIRLVRGVVESRVPWPQWRSRFSVLPKSTTGGDLYPEKLNVNVATREEIQAFLERHRMEDVGALTTNKSVQVSINIYADHAAEIAEALAPEDPSAERTAFDKSSLKQQLRLISAINVNTATSLFSIKNEYYRVRIVTSFNDLDARLDAMVRILRNNDRIGTSAEVLYMTLD